jgi:hypothetical protein
MKKIILILAVVTIFISCDKNSKLNNSTKPIVYCMFTKDNGTNIYRGCAEGKEAMQQKTVELRDQGYAVITNTEKSDCSECQ